jgi:hypothetical protein
LATLLTQNPAPGKKRFFAKTPQFLSFGDAYGLKKDVTIHGGTPISSRSEYGYPVEKSSGAGVRRFWENVLPE